VFRGLGTFLFDLSAVPNGVSQSVERSTLATSFCVMDAEKGRCSAVFAFFVGQISCPTNCDLSQAAIGGTKAGTNNSRIINDLCPICPICPTVPASNAHEKSLNPFLAPRTSFFPFGSAPTAWPVSPLLVTGRTVAVPLSCRF
jgi:hypothetical protein